MQEEKVFLVKESDLKGLFEKFLKEKEESPSNNNGALIAIGEVSKMTGLSQRQIRYRVDFSDDFPLVRKRHPKRYLFTYDEIKKLKQ